MKDLLELLARVLGRDIKPQHGWRARERRKKEGVNINAPVGRIQRPKPSTHATPKPHRSTVRVEVDMKNKERISQLEAENKELRDDLNRQGDLLEKLTKELSELKRSVTPLLPEK